MDAPRCSVCGSEALVTVVSEAGDGALRQYCRDCDRRRLFDERSGVRHIESGSARLLIWAGVVLTVLTVTADRLSISGQEGFGWRQITGAELGFLGIVVGMLLRNALIGVAGAFLLVLSLGADILRVGHATGLGWRKQLALLVASGLLAGGMLWQRHLRKRLLSFRTDRG
jgi:hypothetical protein